MSNNSHAVLQHRPSSLEAPLQTLNALISGQTTTPTYHQNEEILTKDVFREENPTKHVMDGLCSTHCPADSSAPSPWRHTNPTRWLQAKPSDGPAALLCCAQGSQQGAQQGALSSFFTSYTSANTQSSTGPPFPEQNHRTV